MINSISLVVILSAISVFTMVNAQITPVLDVDGNKIQTSTDYYILPASRGMGGGLNLEARNETFCPLYVAQSQLESSVGFSLQFFPVNPEDKFVTLFTDMNFVFSGLSICVQSTVWQLQGVDEVTGRSYVATGGMIGNPGKDTLGDWFRIEKYMDNDYKIVYCPSVCDICRPRCGDLGVFVEDEKRWLGLSEVPFPVIFMKT